MGTQETDGQRRKLGEGKMKLSDWLYLSQRCANKALGVGGDFDRDHTTLWAGERGKEEGERSRQGEPWRHLAFERSSKADTGRVVV